MEDRHFTAECPISKWILFAVCDGHGGTGVVKYLEKILSKRILAALNRASLDHHVATTTLIPVAPTIATTVASVAAAVSTIPPDLDAAAVAAYAKPVRASYLRQAMKLAVVSIDSELEKEMKTSAERGSGSTLLMMAYQPLTRQIVLINVGDSRAVLSLSLEGKTRKLIETKDHKPADKDEFMRITAAGSFVSKDRVGGILALSRAMGDFSLKTSIKQGGGYDPVSGAVCALPDVQVGYINPVSFATVVLACDGIWDVMTSEEAVDVVEQSLARAENPAEKLVHTAFQKLSSDNLTCLVVRLHPALSTH